MEKCLEHCGMNGCRCLVRGMRVILQVCRAVGPRCDIELAELNILEVAG